MPTTTPTDQLRWTDRLAAAATAVEDAREGWEAALEARDRLIVDAIDEGMTTKAAARAARISQSRVMGVIGSPPGDDV